MPSTSGQAGPPFLYGLDIETDTSCDGLDPSRSAILAVAVATEMGDEVWTGEEAALLGGLDAWLAKCRPGVLVTWNGSGFDLPFLAFRARRCGVPLALHLYEDPSVRRRRPLPGHACGYRARWGSHRHVDAYRAWRSLPGQKGLPMGLKAVAGRNGFEPVTVERSAIHLLGEDLLRRYVASDARLARELALLRWAEIAASIDVVPGDSMAALRHLEGDQG